MLHSSNMIVTATIVFVVAFISSVTPAFCPGGTLEESYIYDTVLPKINSIRAEVASGSASPLPNAKGMNKLDWDCSLEEEALGVLDSCAEPTNPYPGDKAHLYWIDPELGIPVEEVAQKWYEEGMFATNLESLAKKVSGKVAYDSSVAEEFQNLIRASTTKIGCAQRECGDIYVLCFTNQPELDDTDNTIYEITTEPCKSEDCDSGKTCNSDGLCDVPPETTTTVAETTTTTTTTTAVVTTVTTAPVTHPGELANGTNQQCPDNVGMTDELRMHFLDTQNYRRSTLAKGQVQRPSGNYLPTGANILKLKLDCVLEKRAIEEVQDCPTSKEPDDMYGKNFDTFPSSTVTSTYRDAIKKAVTNWWKVVRTENNGPGMQVTFRSNHVNQPVESYTQIGWAKTQYLGCAIAKCSSSYTVICLYDPKGNQVDQPLYQIGSTCAACPVGTKCEASLGLCA